MRRATRLRQPSSLTAVSLSAPQCVCAHPATLPIAASAARRALSTTTPSHDVKDRVRNLLWSRGNAPGPKDPYSPDASQTLKQEQLERDLAEAEAELEAAGRTLTENSKQRNTLNKYMPQRSRAPTEEKAAKKGYIAANSAEGLEEVGGYEGWWDQRGRWGKQSEYRPFSQHGIANKVTEKYSSELYVRQAVIEVAAIEAVGKSEEIKELGVDGESFKRSMALGLKVKEDGNAAIEADIEAAQDLVAELLQPVSKSKPKKLKNGHAYAISRTLDSEWKTISLRDPHFKFAVHKRLFQLTGHYIHDAKLAQVNTVQDLINIMVTPPKPAKVYEAIEKQTTLPQLPNVQVYPRRVTPIDKETMVGRWKVIEAELKKRNLPITGHKDLGKPVQRSWIMGKV